jgi:hypothetical protein
VDFSYAKRPLFGEKRLRDLSIFSAEAFGDPAVNRGEQLISDSGFPFALRHRARLAT